MIFTLNGMAKLKVLMLNFLTMKVCNTVFQKIIYPLGRRLDESCPYVDARLPEFGRINAVIPPLSLQGSCLTIRKFSQKPITIEQMLEANTLCASASAFLELAVTKRLNIVVAGGTGSGKTTLLNALSSYIEVTERIITIEDTLELRLQKPHIINLEARPANIEGKGQVSIRQLLINALRMRPDRLIIGECRGAEALDMLQAMNTGHAGSMTTIHANSARDSIKRLVTLALMADVNLPAQAIREQIVSAIDLIIYTMRNADGSRKITSISEVCGLEGNTILSHNIFERNDNKLRSTGIIPRFLEGEAHELFWLAS